MQSVFKSFFVRQGQGQFELDNWDSLWGLLVRITLRKRNHKSGPSTGHTVTSAGRPCMHRRMMTPAWNGQARAGTAAR